uniref:Uncharacterized protein n=1 Tax=Rhizophora mucronata TaxID=61149 RepID=A0A2P2PJV3_RHIMU
MLKKPITIKFIKKLRYPTQAALQKAISMGPNNQLHPHSAPFNVV